VSDLIEIAQPEWIAIETPGAAQVIEVLEVAEQGPAGPPGADGAIGPPGPAGPPGGASYTHVQAVPAADWSINHNLARHPSVTVVDSAGSTVIGDVEYLSNNAIAIHFNAAFGGNAYLN
jgi:hypothetical protein